MIDILPRFFRTVFLLLLAVLGVAMALVFLIATTAAVAIFYAVAKVRGKRFRVHPSWSPKDTLRRNAAQKSSMRAKQNAKDVIDVEVRELR
jgi:hypothetical protein